MTLIRSYFIRCFKILMHPIFLMSGLALIIAATDIQANEHYLRFGFGLDHPETSYFQDEYCNVTDDERPLYGCGIGRDGISPIRSLGNFGNVPVVEFGIGYPSGRTRWELLIEYRPSLSFSGNATYFGSFAAVASSKNITSLSGMVAGFIDFKEVSLFNDRKAVPFVGAGLGIARNRLKGFQIKFPRTTTIVPGAEKTNLVWRIAAGIGFKLDENKTLDLAWHYTDLGSLYTGRGTGRNYLNVSGSPNPDVPDWHQIPTVAELKGHGIRLSLRIKI